MMNMHKNISISLLALMTCTLLAFSCKPKQSTPSTESTAPMNRNKTPLPTNADFKPGPSILPASELIAFFEGGERGLVKAPVVLRIGDGFGSPVEEAFFGVDEGMAAADRVQLDLQDSEMGIPMSEHFREKCPEAGWCKVWVLGHWGAAGGGLGLEEDAGEGVWPFALRGVYREGPEAPAGNGEVRVWVRR